MAETANTGRNASGFIDKSLFLVAAVIGAIAIAALKLRGVNQMVVTAVPVALLVIYVAAISLNTRFRLRLDQAGDNAYYMGFIFTLVSLGVALYQFVGGAQQVTESIIQNFGIALTTTIVGITLRVVLHQMREDPIDTEKAARAELAQLAQGLRAQVGQVMVDINRIRIEFQQRQGEYEAELQQRRDAQDSHAQEVAEAMRLTVTALTKQAGLIDALRLPDDFLAQRFAQLFRGLDQFAAKIEMAVQGNAQMLAQSSEAVANAAAGLRGLGELGPALEDTVKAMRNLAANSAAAHVHTEAIAANAARFVQSMDKSAAYSEIIERQIHEWAQHLYQHQKALAEAVDQSRVATQQVLAQLTEASRNLLQRSRPDNTGQ